MNAYNLLFGSDTFYCIFCRKHKHISHAVFSDTGIGSCIDCHDLLKTYKTAPIPCETEICKTVISVMPYSGIVRNAIGDYKFNNNPAYAKVFAYYINTYTEALNASAPIPFTSFFSMVTAVPLSKKRFYERGYNQSELLAREFANHFNIPANFNAVIKTANTKPQSRMPRIKRQSNVHDVYSANESVVKGHRILLFDDVFTTGSTANSCAAALKEAGAENISVFTFANRKTYSHSPEYHKYFK